MKYKSLITFLDFGYTLKPSIEIWQILILFFLLETPKLLDFRFSNLKFSFFDEISVIETRLAHSYTHKPIQHPLDFSKTNAITLVCIQTRLKISCQEYIRNQLSSLCNGSTTNGKFKPALGG
jgi:hypothetical protein